MFFRSQLVVTRQTMKVSHKMAATPSLSCVSRHHEGFHLMLHACPYECTKICLKRYTFHVFVYILVCVLQRSRIVIHEGFIQILLG
jgi:hypothetical protein